MREGGRDEVESNSGGDNGSVGDNNDNNNNARGESSEAVDARRIPSRGKVDALARALVNLNGLSVTNEGIQALYETLDEYDKKPLTFTLHPLPLRGRFGRSKRGHTTPPLSR